MKLKTLALLLATAISAAHVHAAYSYTAEGVNTGNYSASERFYDSAKGHYWRTLSATNPEKVYAAYTEAGKTFEFLGDLENRVPETYKNVTYDSAEALKNSAWYSYMQDDSGTCWYHTSSNLIQHWQSYYGVFAMNHEDLPYGYTYDRSNLDNLTGIHSLEVGMVFYDKIKPVGLTLGTATDWYFAGNELWDTDVRTVRPYNGTTSPGGYFSNYFVNDGMPAGWGTTSVENQYLTQNNAATVNLLLTATGQKIEGNKTVTETPGQLAYLGLTSAAGPHAITCYGFEVETNHIKSLLVTNSDDDQYGAFKLYMKEGSMQLYTDKECTTPWEFSGASNWRLEEISYINTPDSLKKMYADYTSNETALEWNGHSSTWENNHTTDALPTDEAGWDVYVDAVAEHKNHYNSYYAEGRTVEFGDYGKETTDITVKGEVKAAGMKLNATDSSTNYSFSGDNATINLGDGTLTKSSAGTDRLENLTLLAGHIDLQAGTFEVGENALLQASTAIVANGATLTIDGLAVLGNLTVQQGGQIILAAGGQLGAEITMKAGAILTLKLINSVTQEEILGSMVFDTETNLVMEAPEAVSTRSAVMLRSAAVLGSATTSSTISLEDFVQKANAEMDILQNGQARLVYSNGAMQLQAIPEPTTATLSLLALAALAARRRRR